ncbi:MAG: type VII toxin-antitoxin system HepT family RNase toxin [Promethearchaeota archaeon]
MEEDRIKRYNEKLDYLNQTIENLTEWTENLDVIEFINNLELQKRYGIYHAFQISVEIITDIAAMIVKDIKKIPKDDYSNIDIIKKNKIINPVLAAIISEANGLRNRIVHNYNGLDDNIVYARLGEFLKNVENFKEEIKKWLKKK